MTESLTTAPDAPEPPESEARESTVALGVALAHRVKVRCGARELRRLRIQGRRCVALVAVGGRPLTPAIVHSLGLASDAAAAHRLSSDPLLPAAMRTALYSSR